MDTPLLDLSADAARDALVRASELRLIGLLLERPRADVRAEAAAVAREMVDDGLRAVADGMRGVDEAVYVSLLGPGGPVSPREAAYRRREDPARVLADVAAFYRAFAFRPRTEDPPDHVAVETGFLGYLWLKEAYALTRGDREAAEITASARLRFAQAHLAPLAAGLFQRLAGVEAPELAGLVEALLARTGVTPPPPEEPGEGEDEDELSCGPCGDTPPHEV